MWWYAWSDGGFDGLLYILSLKEYVGSLHTQTGRYKFFDFILLVQLCHTTIQDLRQSPKVIVRVDRAILILMIEEAHRDGYYRMMPSVCRQAFPMAKAHPRNTKCVL